MFSQETVERYVAEGMPDHTDASRGTIRSRLLRTSEAILDITVDRSTLSGLAPSDPTSPYSQAELTILKDWAKSQKTESRRGDAKVLLALGIGAGLSGKEIIGVRAADIDVGDEGVVVTVRGERPREVPVLKRWERSLSKRVASADVDSFVFHSSRKTENQNAITDFVSRDPSVVIIQARRMRTTWPIHHIDAGTPIPVFLDAAGLQSLEALDRFLVFAAPRTRLESVRLLRS